MTFRRIENGTWEVTFPDMTQKWFDGELSEMEVYKEAREWYYGE